MKTKLVYVLTCAPEATYIEQALISIWSARYHNPDAHIVLIVDDKTNLLLVGKRAELLDYISEKMVVELPVDMNILERSRHIKTSVRKLIVGDYLFIDTDTIICRSLEDIDKLDCEVSAVLDYHCPVEKYPKDLKWHLKGRCDKIGVDYCNVKEYFNSGVMYVKDTPIAHLLYEKWHQYWSDGLSNGLIADQPYLLKSDLEIGCQIVALQGVWNTIMYAYPKWINNAYILHFSAHENMNFMFDEHFLRLIRDKGIEAYKEMIINHEWTYIANKWQRPICSFKFMLKGFQNINSHCPTSLQTYLIQVKKKDIIAKLVYCKLYRIAACCVYIFDGWYFCRKKVSKNIKRLLKI